MFWRKRKQSDFVAEIEAHLELETQQLKEQGLSEEEARRTARRGFGNVTRAQERFYDAHRWLWLDDLIRDVSYGLSQLRRNPGFAAVVVITLALGIGSNTAIFSLIDAVMLRSLPVENPSQLVLLRWIARHRPNTDAYWSSGGCATNLGFGAHPSGNPSGCAFSEPLFRRIGAFSK